MGQQLRKYSKPHRKDLHNHAVSWFSASYSILKKYAFLSPIRPVQKARGFIVHIFLVCFRIIPWSVSKSSKPRGVVSCAATQEQHQHGWYYLRADGLCGKNETSAAYSGSFHVTCTSASRGNVRTKVLQLYDAMIPLRCSRLRTNTAHPITKIPISNLRNEVVIKTYNAIDSIFCRSISKTERLRIVSKYERDTTSQQQDRYSSKFKIISVSPTT
jgi:hypothetical protein